MKTRTIAQVSTSSDVLTVTFSDGSVVTLPLTCFPRLAHATPRQRANVRLVGGGIGVHWPSLDEDISVENILRAHSRLVQQHYSRPRLDTTPAHVGMLREPGTNYVAKRRTPRSSKQIVNRKS